MIESKHTTDEIRRLVDKCLPDTLSANSEKMAFELFDKIDINHNGYASLAEVDKGLKEILQVPDLPGLHTMLLKSFDMARVVKQSEEPRENDYITKDEFIYMLIYLRVYYEIKLEFMTLDLNSDGEINFAELQKGKGVLMRWGIDASNLVHVFKDIDTNSGGTISFREFCEWAIKKYFNKEFGVPVSD